MIADEELRAQLGRRADVAQRLDVRALALAATARARPAPRPTTHLVGGISLAASVAVAIALCASVLVREAPVASPSNASVPTGSIGSTLPDASPVVRGPAAWTDLVWNVGETQAFETTKETQAVDGLADERGFLVVGFTDDGEQRNARVWRSVDGVAWESLSADGLADVEPARVLPLADGYAIVGTRPMGGGATEPPPLGIWWSADGTSWRDVTPAEAAGLVVGSVAAGPDGLLLATREIGAPSRQFMLAIASDFSAERFDARWAPDVRIRSVAAGGQGWLATGATGAGSASTMRAEGTLGAIWTSPDGSAWSSTPVDDPGGVVYGVEPVAGGYIAFGSPSSLRCEGCLGTMILRPPLAVWSSTDGTSWRRTATVESGPGFRVNDSIYISPARLVAGEGRGLLFNTSEEYQLSTSESVDGVTWADVRNWYDTSASAEDPARLLGFEGPVIVGGSSVVAFRRSPDDSLAPTHWPLPLVGIANARAGGRLATFPPNPPSTPNDVTCPNNLPCDDQNH